MNKTYAGSIGNKGSFKVESLFKSDDKPSGVKTQSGGDLRAKNSTVKSSKK